LISLERRTLNACGVLFVSATLLSGCGPASTSEGGGRNILTIGVPEGVVAGTDLGVQSLATALTLEGLTQLSPDGRPIPRLAQSWSWERDGLSLRMVLRPDVILHDGTPLTAGLAADLVRDAVTRPSNRAQLTSLSDITAIRGEGEYELVIDLARRSVFLLEDLELPLAVGPQRLGTGPYRVVKREPTEIVLQRFEKYYLGIPKIDEVVIKPFGMRTAWASLLRGEVDVVTEIPPDAVEFVQNEEVDVISYERRYQYLVAFNSSRPPFNSAPVRRALNYAINRDTLIQDILELGNPSTGPLWPKHWAYDTSVASYTFDAGLAAALLDSAGVRQEIRQAGRPGSRLRFTCLIPANFSLIERVGLHVQKQLYDVGVDMQFEVVSIEEFGTRIREGRFEAILPPDMVSGPSFGRSYLFWASQTQFKGLNVFGYENAEAERLFGILRTSVNEAAIRSATSNLQRVLLEDPPALFLAWNERSRAVRRDFKVIRDPGRDPVSTIWRWDAADRSANTQ
jgi:ABC-type transport system substrate-binding protein